MNTIRIRNYASIYDSAFMTVNRTVHDSVTRSLDKIVMGQIIGEEEDFLWDSIQVVEAAVSDIVSDIITGTVARIISDE